MKLVGDAQAQLFGQIRRTIGQINDAGERTPCQGDPEEWDCDHSPRAVRGCGRCPLEGLCRQFAHSLPPITNGVVGGVTMVEVHAAARRRRTTSKAAA